MNINGLNFLTTISKHLKYRTAQYGSRILKSYTRCFVYLSQGGFKVTEIYCDDELCPLQTLMANQEPDIKFTFSNPIENMFQNWNKASL
jgi:hypothetical protein